jgi:hypothetical protein
MARKNSKKTIEELERQIEELTIQLQIEKSKSESLWQDVYDLFLAEGNEEETAAYFASQFSNIVSSWAKKKRDILAKSVATTGIMPPYSDCLNHLVVAFTPPGEEPTLLGDVPVPEKEDIIELPEPQSLVISLPTSSESLLSEDARPTPPKMKRVNVPKGIAGAKPLSLLDSEI